MSISQCFIHKYIPQIPSVDRVNNYELSCWGTARYLESELLEPRLSIDHRTASPDHLWHKFL
jgi:hypothetical protein